jgi:hypothetical protein
MSFISRIIGGGSQQLPQLLGPPVQAPAASAAAAPVTAAPSTVFVELGEASQQAAISRNGVQIPIVDFNPATLGTALGQTTQIPAKVVTQSIQPGVSVAKGASVDLVLAEPSSIQVSVLQNGFVPFATQSLDEVYKNVVRDNTAVQSVLARNQSATALSAADQATLTSALGDTSVTSDPGHNLDSAFQTLQAAFTFGT